ncbi:MAG: chromo domain-containing protein [Candidatus Thiodiazotropha sp.]
MYLKKSKIPANKKKPLRSQKTNFKIKKTHFKLKKGDFVRVSFSKRPFVKSYMDQFSTEVFKVSNRQMIQGIPIYQLEDLQGEAIQGNFYNSELLRLNKNIDNLWFIEKIIKKRKRKGHWEYFVQWEGFPKKFNSWLLKDDIKELKEVPQ